MDYEARQKQEAAILKAGGPEAIMIREKWAGSGAFPAKAEDWNLIDVVVESSGFSSARIRSEDFAQDSLNQARRRNNVLPLSR